MTNDPTVIVPDPIEELVIVEPSAGFPGATGRRGPAGPQGPQGNQGPPGRDGRDGLQGPVGPVGPRGVDGVAGATGATGAQGNQGPPGRDGRDGVQGPEGVPGAAGAAGAAGATGSTGATGPQGNQGPPGRDGAQGEQGDVGPQGNPGPTGATGAAGADGADATYRFQAQFATLKGVALTTSTGTHRYYVTGPSGATFTIKAVWASVGTAPTGASILIDVHKNGTTIYTTQGNRPAITATNFSSGRDADMDVTSVAEADYLTVDVDQVGSTIAGADLVVIVEIEVVP